jgi:hypothetical protein
MKTYIATFYTAANYAEHEIEADTPEQALASAREIEGGDDSALYYESYDHGQPVNAITIRDDASNDVAEWQSDELRLRLAAQDLLDAAQLALRELRGFYSDGESEAVKILAEAIGKAKPNSGAA